jgi:hypothetical protein
VSGTVALDSATLAALETTTVSVNNFPATQSVSATDLDIRSLSSAQDSVTVTGSVNVGNFPATQTVSGTVEITNDVGNPIPVSGSVSATVTATDLDIRNLSSAQDNVRAFDSTDSEYLRIATSVTATGDTTLVTPAAGKRIRLQWVYAINDPVASTSTKITVKLGSAVQYVAWAISKRQQLTGAVDAPLVINLSNLGDVAVTVFYQEV